MKKYTQSEMETLAIINTDRFAWERISSLGDRAIRLLHKEKLLREQAKKIVAKVKAEPRYKEVLRELKKRQKKGGEL